LLTSLIMMFLWPKEAKAVENGMYTSLAFGYKDNNPICTDDTIDVVGDLGFGALYKNYLLGYNHNSCVNKETNEGTADYIYGGYLKKYSNNIFISPKLSFQRDNIFTKQPVFADIDVGYFVGDQLDVHLSITGSPFESKDTLVMGVLRFWFQYNGK